MPQLVMLVIHDPGKVDSVIDAWLKAGVTGMTLLDSSGLAQQEQERNLRDDVPLLPSVRTLLRGMETRSRTLFSLVDEDFDVDTLVGNTEEVLGSLDNDGNGILFVVPVSRVEGLQSRSGPPPIDMDED
ncbi:MAG: P-II family nitrogen regulator [Anaerolineales bacterium]|nr:P-II family nitrogen regulator [Anaerolineales bacterium]